MTEKQKSAFDAVEKINAELYEKYKKRNDLDSQPIVSITFASDYIFISVSTTNLPEIPIYSSLDDERIYYEKSDKYETYYKFIKRKFLEIKEELYSIKL